MEYSVKYDGEFEHFYVQSKGKPRGILEVARILNMYVDKIAELEGNQAKRDLKQHQESIANFCCWLIDNGEPIPEEHLQKFGSDYLVWYQKQAGDL